MTVKCGNPAFLSSCISIGQMKGQQSENCQKLSKMFQKKLSSDNGTACCTEKVFKKGQFISGVKIYTIVTVVCNNNH